MASTQDFRKDIKKIIFHYASHYKFFLAIILVFLLGAHLYNRTLVPVYQNWASIHMVKDRASFFSTDFSFESAIASPQMGMRFGMGLDDELTLLNSFSTVQKTLQQLHFEITYYQKDTVFPHLPFLKKITRNIELYDNLPISVQYDASHDQPVYKEFVIRKTGENTCRLTCSPKDGYRYNYIDNVITEELDGKGIDVEIPLNEVFENDFLKLQLTKNYSFASWPVGSQISFILNHLDYLTLEYKDNLSLSTPSPMSFIVNISAKGKNFNKTTEFLNTFVENILDHDLYQKNELAVSTISFIDSQLGDITDSLAVVKTNLQSFRASNKVTDLSFQGQRLFDQVSTLEEQKVSLQMQKRYYEYITEYLSKTSNNSELVSPASMNVIDPLLTDMIYQLSTLYNQFNNYSKSSSTSIYLKDLQIKINNLENSIKESASNNLGTIELQMNELQYRLDKLSRQISELPKTELKLFDIEREFKMNDAVLTFLMQKRSEAQVAMASTQPSYDVVEPARYLKSDPISPKKSLNYIIAFMAGVFLPFAYILISDFLDYKVRTKHDLQGIERFTFLGRIFRNAFPEEICVTKYPDSSIAESFRTVRTNLQFMMDYNESRIISITSTSSGEGKSFFAANLGTSYAASGRRTIILEFDLRRPQVGKMFNIKDLLGLTSFLSNNANIDDIIQRTEFPNLDIILAGNPAPNPPDLIASDKVAELTDYLKASYELIIIDTAPVGIVSESYHLMKQSDVNLFLVRQGYSHKELVNQTIENVQNAKLGKLAIVLNDVDHRTFVSYKQANYNKYYKDEPQRRFLKLIGRK